MRYSIIAVVPLLVDWGMGTALTPSPSHSFPTRQVHQGVALEDEASEAVAGAAAAVGAAMKALASAGYGPPPAAAISQPGASPPPSGLLTVPTLASSVSGE